VYKSKAKVLSTFKLIKRMVYQFIILTIYRGMPTPIDWVLYIRIYRFSIQYGTTREGRVV